MPSIRLFTRETEDNPNEPRPVHIRIWSQWTVVAVVEVHPADGARPTILPQTGVGSPLDLNAAVDIELDPWSGHIRVNTPGSAGLPAITSFAPAGPFDEEPPF